MSVRWRLTIWYMGVLAATMAAFGLVLYLSLAQGRLREAGRSVQSRAAEVSRSLVFRTVAPSGAVAVYLPRMDVFASPDMFVQAVDAYGAIIGRSGNLGQQSLPVTQGTRDTIRTGKAAQDRLTIGRQEFLLYNQPMFPDEPGTGVIQVAMALGHMSADMQRLRLLLILIGSGSLLLAGLLGAVLARKALSPIDQLTQAAQAIGASRDLTRRVEHEGPADEVGRLASTFNEMLERLDTAHNQLEAALAAQKRFVADASHELRTPLTVIRTNAEALRFAGDQLPEGEREQVLDDIISETERVTRLVSDLLTLARADAGRHLERVPVDLDAILQDVHRQGKALGPGHAITLEAGRAAQVLGHADSLKQLLLILVDNAIKYTPAGRGVTLGARREGGWVEVRVRDQGQGIAAEDIPHLFERFYRADRARGAGGAGLGLAIAHWIVEEHQGEITVESAPGQGSTFIVRLPVAGQKGRKPHGPERATA